MQNEKCKMQIVNMIFSMPRGPCGNTECIMDCGGVLQYAPTILCASVPPWLYLAVFGKNATVTGGGFSEGV